MVDWKQRYISKTLDYLQDSETFISTEVDPGVAIGERVQSWADKWEGAEGITREVCDWIKVHSPRPATVYGNIKLTSRAGHTGLLCQHMAQQQSS